MSGAAANRSAGSQPARGLRLLRDGLLILALLLIFTSYDFAGLAKDGTAEMRSPSPGANAPAYPALPAGWLESAAPLGALAPIDFNTMMAAVFAAENAALTPPQYLVNIPLLSK